ncbi:Siroheme synthase / Precorrin-2 oxidase [Klebsiella variicola]|nr:Siroheme synthase / Precorrin-2 oxidase [Klebsiella variicola]
MNDRLAQSLANDESAGVADTTEQLLTEPLEHRGEVVLVGAGPGDAGLLTLKGLQQIQQADVVVYDRLVSDDIMNLVRRDADRVFVGKRSGYHCVPQEEINQILLREAQKGKRVVRLKGGDPFIFGRGGEELETLCEAGHPLLRCSRHHRRLRLLRLLGDPVNTPRFRPGRPPGHRPPENRRRAGLGEPAVEKQTLVFYMGLNQAPAIREKLIAHGMAEDMPAAIVENGTAVSQKVVSGTLGQLDIWRSRWLVRR